MGKTENFRQQHKELLQIANEMSPLLKADQLTANINAVAQSLAKLAGKLNVHLSMEDKVLYPKLMEHQDPNVKSVANKFVSEMGKIKEVYTQYLNKWPSPESIKKNPAEFINETKGIFDALSKRIQREDAELYAMVDRLN